MSQVRLENHLKLESQFRLMSLLRVRKSGDSSVILASLRDPTPGSPRHRSSNALDTLR